MHRLRVSHGQDQAVGELGFAPQQDRWTFAYDGDWLRRRPFQLSTAFEAPPGGYDTHAIRRFIVNLFPEGAPLRAAIEQLHVAPGNAFALLRSMGGETTGALEFHAPDQPAQQPLASRVLPRAELQQRILAAQEGGLAVWDGRLRMSIAGYQDKLAVFAISDPGADTAVALHLAEPPLASTYILKPQPQSRRTSHLVANEHYCMQLAARYAGAVARTSILRLPTPVLVVERFDRQRGTDSDPAVVRKLHVIDACQAWDMPVEAKYERYLGTAAALANHRDGMSLPRLFATAPLMRQPAKARLEMLRWVLFQLVVGNAVAHGKNFSFFLQGELLEPAPWYDLVSVAQYPVLDQSYAMGVGDAFGWDELAPMQLAYFAHRCGIGQGLLQRETVRLARAMVAAPDVLDAQAYTQDERAFLLPICAMAQARSQALVEKARAAAVFGAEHF